MPAVAVLPQVALLQAEHPQIKLSESSGKPTIRHPAVVGRIHAHVGGDEEARLRGGVVRVWRSRERKFRAPVARLGRVRGVLAPSWGSEVQSIKSCKSAGPAASSSRLSKASLLDDTPAHRAPNLVDNPGVRREVARAKERRIRHSRELVVISGGAAHLVARGRPIAVCRHNCPAAALRLPAQRSIAVRPRSVPDGTCAPARDPPR